MNGLIAFFDILGYKSFLHNNSATDSALRVLDLITGTPRAVHDRFGRAWKEGVATTVEKEVADALAHLVFSDTVVLTLPYPEKPSDDWQKAAIGYMTFFAAHVTAEMFAAGLPLRGSIHEGEFITKQTCLAGLAVVEAYELSESLDHSGVIFSPTLSKRINAYQSQKPMFTTSNYDQYFVRYLTPLANGKEEHFIHFNWVAFMKTEDKKACRADVDSFVMKSFWAHQKDCARAVDQKIHNTIKLVRRLILANPSG